jgi:hypothetical protein
MISTILTNAVNNKHTSIAGVTYVAAKYFCPVLAQWFPKVKSQLDFTAQALEGLAVFYGFAMAGDAKASQPEAPPAPKQG